MVHPRSPEIGRCSRITFVGVTTWMAATRRGQVSCTCDTSVHNSVNRQQAGSRGGEISSLRGCCNQSRREGALLERLSQESPPLQLTESGSIQMELIQPLAEAKLLATTFFRLRCDELLIRDVQPSSIGIFAIMPRGSGAIHFVDGRAEPSHSLTLFTPTSAAATFVVNGPWEMFGAMLIVSVQSCSHSRRIVTSSAEKLCFETRGTNPQ